MSRIRADQITNKGANGAPNFPNGLVVTGVITATTLNQVTSGILTASTLDVSGNATISGNLGVAGTITYEDVARVDATGISTFREGFGVGPLAGIALTAYKDGSIRTSGVVTATSYYGSGANLTGIDASSIKYGGAVKAQANAGGVVITGVATATTFVGNLTGNVTGNTSGSSGSCTGNSATTSAVTIADEASDTETFPLFTPSATGNQNVKSSDALKFNSNTGQLIASKFTGAGTVEVHSYNLDSAGDVGNNGAWVDWNMTPTIDWNRAIIHHSGSHRGGHDTHYYCMYQFNKGGGDINQNVYGQGRALQANSWNQGWSWTAVAMNNDGTPMSGNASTQCTFKAISQSGDNSAPANDNGRDHHSWVMFIHD
tara:strand:+ start:621 stop:1736 length:1116 start_codon:yes stop_codon:yes gene_type:complete